MRRMRGRRSRGAGGPIRLALTLARRARGVVTVIASRTASGVALRPGIGASAVTMLLLASLDQPAAAARTAPAVARRPPLAGAPVGGPGIIGLLTASWGALSERRVRAGAAWPAPSACIVRVLRELRGVGLRGRERHLKGGASPPIRVVPVAAARTRVSRGPDRRGRLALARRRPLGVSAHRLSPCGSACASYPEDQKSNTVHAAVLVHIRVSGGTASFLLFFFEYEDRTLLSMFFACALKF